MKNDCNPVCNLICFCFNYIPAQHLKQMALLCLALLLLCRSKSFLCFTDIFPLVCKHMLHSLSFQNEGGIIFWVKDCASLVLIMTFAII